MAFCNGFQMFGNGFDCPSLDEGYRGFDYWPYILGEPHEGLFGPLALHGLGYRCGGLEDDLVHRDPVNIS